MNKGVSGLCPILKIWLGISLAASQNKSVKVLGILLGQRVCSVTG
jgi:hypothetical protein